MSHDHADVHDAAHKLLDASAYLSPTGTVQQAFVRIFNEAPSDGEAVLALLNALHDGWAHGNWPVSPSAGR